MVYGSFVHTFFGLNGEEISSNIWKSASIIFLHHIGFAH